MYVYTYIDIHIHILYVYKETHIYVYTKTLKKNKCFPVAEKLFQSWTAIEGGGGGRTCLKIDVYAGHILFQSEIGCGAQSHIST